MTQDHLDTSCMLSLMVYRLMVCNVEQQSSYVTTVLLSNNKTVNGNECSVLKYASCQSISHYLKTKH